MKCCDQALILKSLNLSKFHDDITSGAPFINRGQNPPKYQKFHKMAHIRVGSYMAEHENKLFFQRNSEKLHTFWRISENRNIVRHRNLEFRKREYGKSLYHTDTNLLKRKYNSILRTQ